MVYLGRIEGGGLTKEGREVVLRAVTVRSEKNRIRIAEAYPSRIYINSPLFRKPYGELTQEEKEILREQQEQAENIFYNGIIAPRVIYPDYSFAVVGNGRHTDSIVGRYRRSSDTHEIVIRHVLNKWGPELDGPNKTPQTPRIAGMVGVGTPEYTLGIISRSGEAKTFVVPHDGTIRGLSTYAGDPNDRMKMVINHSPSLITLPSEERSAKQLADDLFDWLDKDLVVITAAAVWDPNRMRWEFGRRNLYS